MIHVTRITPLQRFADSALLCYATLNIHVCVRDDLSLKKEYFRILQRNMVALSRELKTAISRAETTSLLFSSS